MTILFLTISSIESIEIHSIYTDLLRCFRNHGHKVYAITPYERRIGKHTEIQEEENVTILHVKTGNVTKTDSIIEKGISQVLIDNIYLRAVKKYFSPNKFDIVLYSTPPIMFCKTIQYIKKRDDSLCYLLLKDIFPQNAVDIGMLSKKGFKAIIYYYFKRKEKQLYSISERIGCMSQANVDYITMHNKEICYQKVEICPNSIEVLEKHIMSKKRNDIYKKYGIPFNKTVFIYGGNLGKPQGISFFIECLSKIQYYENRAFFLVVGSGTEYSKVEDYIRKASPDNVQLIEYLPKEEYDEIVRMCDVGLIFLDHRFTIPNFPSRLLAYMESKLPVLACTDPNTDIGEVVVENKFGWWCESDNCDAFCDIVRAICEREYDLLQMGENGYKYLLANYTVEHAYQQIIKWCNQQ